MSNLPNIDHNPQFDRYGAGSPQNLTVEVPSQALYRYPRRTRSGMTPMGIIELEGHAFSRMSHGSVSWWIAIACWCIYGIPMSLIFGPSLWFQFQTWGALVAVVWREPLAGMGWINLFGMSLVTLFSVLIAGAILIILVRGTLHKIRRRRV